VKFSQFQSLLEDEFGSGFTSVILNDTRLTEFADLTPSQLLDAGEDPRQVWFGICRHLGVPKDRWHGKSKPKRHAE
jgi:Protein of unknown function (DUF3046)